MANTNNKQTKQPSGKTEVPKVETPKTTPKAEVKPEAPKVEAPKVEPKPEVKQEPKAEAPKEAPKVETVKPTVSVLEVTESDSINLKNVKEFLSEYLTEMKPGRTHANNSGAIMQVRLYRTIQSIFRMEGEEFSKAYGTLLATIKSNLDGCFSDRYYARYFDTFNLSKTDSRNFARVMNMLIVTCDLSKVKLTLQQVDIAKTLEGFNNPQLEQLVQGFYNR